MENKIIKIENKASYGITWYEHGQAYFGSHRGMRFRLARNPMEDVALLSPDKKGDAVFEAVVWPEPVCYEGKEQMIAWLNEQYETRYEEWEAVRAKH